jgi:hypothetical protein
MERIRPGRLGDMLIVVASDSRSGVVDMSLPPALASQRSRRFTIAAGE